MNEKPDEVQIERWVNLEDIAEYLSVSQDTIRMWLKNGKLPINKAGKRCQEDVRVSVMQICL